MMQSYGGALRGGAQVPTGYSSDPNTTPGNTTDNDPELRATTGSPMTEVTGIINKPDITIRCQQCDLYIDLRMLNEHRQYHLALEVMKYKGGNRPESVAKLMQRRRAILRLIKSKSDSSEPLNPEILQKVNDAYEFLKADLEETYEAYRRVREDLHTEVHASALNSTVECIYAIGMCSNANERWKNCMEDTRSFEDCFGGDQEKSYFGLYDGHHGIHAAEAAARELHHALLFEMAKFDPKINWNCQLADAEHGMDALEKSPRKYVRTSPRVEGEEHHGIYEDGVCAISQVIKGHKEKMDQLKKQRENESESNRDTDTRNKEDKENRTVGRIEQECLLKTKSGKKKKFRNAYCEQLSLAFHNAFKFTDLLLSWGKDEQSRVRWSGCSALSIIIQNTTVQREETGREEPVENMEQEGGHQTEEPRELGLLHLAQAGDVHCVLVRGNRSYCLTKDHTPNNPRERARIERLGGSISESQRELRVNGVVTSTHGLGNHGDVALKLCVTSEPYTTVVPVDQYAQFVILATRGVWEVFSPEEAAQMLIQLLPYNQVPPASRLNASIRHLLAARSHMTRSQSVDTSHVPASELMDRVRAYSSMTVRSVGLPKHLLNDPDGNKLTPADTPQHGNQVSENVDMKTEVGSHYDGFLDEESGDEADSAPFPGREPVLPESRLSLAPPTQEEVHREFAKMMSERLVQAAILAGAKDNITVMIILLPGSGV